MITKKVRRQIINNIISIEGGYVDDKHDSGGKTKFGITAAVAAKHGIGDVKTLSRDQAYAIYRSDYWDQVGGDEILRYSEDVAAKLFDIAVSMGVGRASEFLQVSLNGLNQQQRLYPDLKVDRDIGKKTLAALRAYFAYRKEPGVSVLLKALLSQQGAFYMDLAQRRPKDQRFLYGWLDKRVSLPPVSAAPAPKPIPHKQGSKLQEDDMYSPARYSPDNDPMQQPPPDGYVVDEITGQQLPYWNTQRDRFEKSKDSAFAAWIKQEHEKVLRANGKPSLKSKIIAAGVSMAGSGIATLAAMYGFNIDAETLVAVASTVLFGGGSAVAIMRKWFTTKFLY